MTKLTILILCIGSLLINTGAVAQDSTIKQTTTHSVFKGIFLSVWSKLKSLNPTQKQSAKSVQIYTVGMRGAESTDTLLKPYWKNDLARDVQFQTELKRFSLAQQKLDSGELEDAAREFDKFLVEYSSSSLRPNALFAKSLSLAGTGNKEMSITAMKQFIDENPNHPMVKGAKQVINEISR